MSLSRQFDGTHWSSSPPAAGRAAHLRPLSLLASAALAAGFLSLAAAPAQASGNTYYVATTGSDANTGASPSAAFATIQQCANVAQPGDTCEIEAGTYHETVTPPTSGTAGAPITFTNAGTGTVTVDGADPITTAWSAVTASNMSALEASDSRLSASPMAAAVASGQVFEIQTTLGSDLSTDQLFIDGTMANLAQWPAPGSDLSHEVLGQAQSSSGLTLNDTNITQPAGYWTGTQLWANDWFVSATTTVTASTTGSVTSAAWPTSCEQFGQGGRGTRYRLYGSLEALSAPDQWYYNATAGTLYLWLPQGDAPSNHVIESKSRQLAFDLTNASHIDVKGLSIFGSTIQTGAAATGDVLDHLTASYVSQYTDLSADPNLVASDPCNVITAGETTSGIVLNGTDNTLSSSTIAYSAGNGVVTLGTGDTVVQNDIHDTDYDGSYAAAIQLIGSGQTIEYNTVYNSGRSALTTDNHTNGSTSSNNRIAYNDFSSTGYMSSDNGPLYVCCSINMTGTSIDHNWIHDDNSNEFGYGGVYLDNYTSDATVDHNAIWDISQGHGVFVNGGSGNQIDYNTYQGPLYQQGSTASGNPTANNLLVSQTGEYVNASAHDYQLVSGASAIDAGTLDAPLTNDSFGAAPDQGAYEYGGPDWIAGCTAAACWAGKTGTGALTTTSVYDASAAALSSGLTVASDQLGTTDGSYVPMTATGQSVAFTVPAASSEAATIDIRYSTAAPGATGSIKTLSLYLNGSKLQQVALPTTLSPSDWAIATVTATVPAGSNTVTVQADSTDTAGVNLDGIVVNSPYTVLANSGTLSAGAYVATAGDGTGDQVVAFPGAGAADTLTLPNSAGAKSVVIHYSNANPTGTVTVSQNGGAGFPVTLPSTGSWATSSTVTIPVSFTQSTNTLTFTRNGAGDTWWNFYDITLEPTSLVTLAPAGTLSGGADVATAVDGTGDQVVAFPGAGASETLTLPQSAGTQSLLVHYSNANPAGTVTVSINGGTAFALTIPSTSSWTKSATLSIPVAFAQPVNTISFTRGSSDIWWNFYDITTAQAPAVIPAPAGTLSGGADVATAVDGTGDQVVAFPGAGASETLTLPQSAGTQSLLVHYSNANPAGTTTVSINGGTAFTLTIPSTSSWTKSATLSIPVSFTQTSNTISFTRGSSDIWWNFYDVTLIKPAMVTMAAPSTSGTLAGAAVATAPDGSEAPVVYFPDAGASDTMTLANSSGMTTLVVHYSNANATGTVTVSVNGGTSFTVTLPSTGTWKTESTVSIPVWFTQASNAISFTRGSSDIWWNFYGLTASNT